MSSYARAMSDQEAPLVIAHRGASGYRPEHTIAAYELAIKQGADYIEPDLVSTKDGVLVVRHENEISETTDVAAHPEFASRRTSKTIDGIPRVGFFTEDFTLAELKTLRAKERIPHVRPESARFDGAFEILTLDEVIALAQDKANGRTVGVYPETKHPTYFRSIGLPLEELLVQTLHARGYRGRGAPVYIQSFELSNLVALRRVTELPLVQLMEAEGAPFDLVSSGDARDYQALRTPAELARLAAHVDAIGVHKHSIVPRDAGDDLSPPTRLVEHAHRAGLQVHAWTFRRENAFLPVSLRSRGEPPHAYGDLAGELALFFSLGVDGVFCDHPDVAVAARSSARS